MTGEELKRRREKIKLSQTDLAELLEVKQTSVSRWETGASPILKTVELAFENIENKLKRENE